MEQSIHWVALLTLIYIPIARHEDQMMQICADDARIVIQSLPYILEKI